jgi:WD40 repeat protein
VVLDVSRAVKVLHPALVSDPEFIERFRREAKIAAQLEHPHIVPVYELDEVEGAYFLVMRYMPGGSLKDLLAHQGRLPFDSALEITRQIADALDFAHHHPERLVHRDVKPGNILFEAEPTSDKDPHARLNDFGFAKALSGAGSASLSASGGMIGTPPYMAPEVWRGKEVSPATDVYSLACVCYEMVTGEVLFSGDSPPEIMTKHMLDGPQFPEEWPEGTPQGMGAVLAVALEREPAERYSSTLALVQALEGAKRSAGQARQEAMEKAKRLADERARQETEQRAAQINHLKQEAQDAIKRQFWNRAGQILAKMERLGAQSKKEAEQMRQQLTQARKATEERAQEGAKRRTGETQSLTEQAQAALGWEDWSTAKVYIRRLESLGAEGRAAAARLRAQLPKPWWERIPTWGWALGGLLSLVIVIWIGTGNGNPSPTEEPPLETPIAAAVETTSGVSPKLSSTPHLPEGAINRLGKGDIYWFDLSPDGKYLSIISSLGIYIFEMNTYEQVWFLPYDSQSTNLAFAWSPDGKLFASSTKSGVSLWDVDTGEQVLALEEVSVSYNQIKWSPEGNTLASGTEDGTVLLWDLQSGEVRCSLEGGSDSGYSYNFTWSPNGTMLAHIKSPIEVPIEGPIEEEVFFWDAEKCVQLYSLEETRFVGWSPNEEFFATHTKREVITIRYLAFGNEFRSFEHAKFASWSGDGSLIAIGNINNAIEIIDMNTGDISMTLPSETSNNVNSVEWSPQRDRLASRSWNVNRQMGTIEIWNLNTGELAHTLNSQSRGEWSEDGSIFISDEHDYTITTWDTNSWEQIHTLPGFYGPIYDIAWSQESNLYALAGMIGKLAVLRKNGGLLDVFSGHQERVCEVAFSPDGHQLASGSYDNNVIIWDVSTGEPEITLDDHKGDVCYIEWSPDGSKIATGSHDKTIILWDSNTYEKLAVLQGHTDLIQSMKWSPGGNKIASGSRDGIIIVWNGDTGNQITKWEGHDWNIYDLSWSPSSNKIATGGFDGSLKIWLAETGNLEQVIEESGWDIHSIAYDDTGERIAAGSRGKTVAIWSTLTGELLSLFEGHNSSVTSLLWLDKGDILVSGSYDGSLIEWSTSQ